MQKISGVSSVYVGEEVVIDIANRLAIGPFGMSEIAPDDWVRAARLEMKFGRDRFPYLSKLYAIKQERAWKS